MQKCRDTEYESVPERGCGCQHPPELLNFIILQKEKCPQREFKQFCPQQKSSKILLFTILKYSVHAQNSRIYTKIRDQEVPSRV